MAMFAWSRLARGGLGVVVAGLKRVPPSGPLARATRAPMAATECD